MKIVIVDDEPKIRNGLQHLIESAGQNWQVDGTFEEAESALKFIYENHTDVLLTDIRMPSVSGLELIYRVKEIDSEIQMIILTGYSDFTYAQRAIELGVCRYLTKPTKPKEIFDALQSAEGKMQLEESQKLLYSAQQESVQNQLVRKTMQYIELNYAKKISLEVISSDLYITPNYLCELFKKHTGKTLTEYIAEYRVGKAKELLKNPRYKVSEIAEMVGISDAKYFSSTFKKFTGMTPLEYRNTHFEMHTV